VAATADALKTTVEQMAIVEELRRTLRNLQDPKLGSS